MRRAVIILASLFVTPQIALADNAMSCTKAENGQFLAALERSERLALTATTAIGPSPVFDRWFGPYNAKSGDVVRGNMKAIVTVLRSGNVTARCRNFGEGLCGGETYAFVNLDTPFLVNLCPNFFAMDTMKQLTSEAVRAGNGTRAGTLIHEVSHFSEVAATEDVCYSREDCTEMARSSVADALINADTYQYFAEDVTFFGADGENRNDDPGARE